MHTHGTCMQNVRRNRIGIADQGEGGAIPAAYIDWIMG